MALCSLNYREWSGCTVGVYEMHHEHEYSAIRNSRAHRHLPLFKYRITGPDATKFVNRVISRDIIKVSVDQVIYCCWCDPEGKVIDDGTITRLGENDYRWTAADPSLRWFQQTLSASTFTSRTSRTVAALAQRLLAVLGSSRRCQYRRPEYFRARTAKLQACPSHFPHQLHRRPWLQEIWTPWKMPPRLGQS
jgi:aminomethyltransferase